MKLNNESRSAGTNSSDDNFKVYSSKITWRNRQLSPCIERESLSHKLTKSIIDRLFKICFSGALDFIEDRIDSTDNEYIEKFYDGLLGTLVGCVKDFILEEGEMRKLEESLKKEFVIR